MLIDSFLFFNELDLLEIRLNALAPYVDRFVLCERATTHSGKSKPLYFADNKDRFKDFPITHLIQPPVEGQESTPGTRDGRAWKLEHRQRDYLMHGLKDLQPEDWFMLSDLDEIPNLDNWDGKSEGAFKQKIYYYYFNCYTGVSNWKGSILQRWGSVKTDLNDVRNKRNHYPTIVPEGGWHFSTIGTPEEIIYKIESFAHCELNTDEYKAKIAERRANLEDPYGRAPKNWENHPRYSFSVEDPSGPKWLLDNRDKYGEYFYEEKQALQLSV